MNKAEVLDYAAALSTLALNAHRLRCKKSRSKALGNQPEPGPPRT
jgi:hypothetical protein